MLVFVSWHILFVFEGETNLWTKYNRSAVSSLIRLAPSSLYQEAPDTERLKFPIGLSKNAR